MSRIRRTSLRVLTTITLGVMPLLPITGCSGKFFRGSKDIVGLTISPVNGSIQPESTQQFTATGSYYDSTTGDVTPETTWTSSDPAIASINSEGLASGVSPGVVTISADCQSYVIHTHLTISRSAATLSSIAVTPPESDLQAGNTQQFTATGTYSNGMRSVITSSATWSSSSMNIATISSAGLVRGVSTGNVIITATANGVSGHTTLAVQ